MNNDFLKLTNSVYKVLEFFPESDPLKHRAKDKALSIMESFVLLKETSGWASFQKEKIKTQILEDIDVLLGYLWIGKIQGWLNSSNYLIIDNEYGKIKKFLGPVLEPTQKLPGFGGEIIQDHNTENHAVDFEEEAEQDNSTPEEITDRQKKIMEFLKENERAQVVNLQTILPGVTKRTIRRDLDELLEQGAIMRIGDFNQVFYKLA